MRTFLCRNAARIEIGSLLLFITGSITLFSENFPLLGGLSFFVTICEIWWLLHTWDNKNFHFIDSYFYENLELLKYVSDKKAKKEHRRFLFDMEALHHDAKKKGHSDVASAIEKEVGKVFWNARIQYEEQEKKKEQKNRKNAEKWKKESKQKIEEKFSNRLEEFHLSNFPSKKEE